MRFQSLAALSGPLMGGFRSGICRPLLQYYTPLFAGVIWDAVDVDLEDIEQIEVVRGPGAVMWGPNAVNGVINTIAKQAQATKGGTASVATGNQLRGDPGINLFKPSET